MVRPPTYLRFLYPGVVWNKPTNEKILYLTFDDGPTPEVTSSVLDLLSLHNAKATFFCIGENVKKHPTLYNRIKAEGHAIGNHTNTHPNSWKVKYDFYLKDVEEARKVIDSNLFRPPYGKLTWGQYRQLKKTHRIVLWDVMSYDFDSSLPPQQCLQQVLRHARNGSCIVFHDTLHCLPRLQYCLPALLKHYTAQGFRFEAVP